MYADRLTMRRMAVSGAVCTCLLSLMTSPQVLPEPLRWTLEKGVDAAAFVCLWTWNEPTDALADPHRSWSVYPLTEASPGKSLPRHLSGSSPARAESALAEYGPSPLGSCPPHEPRANCPSDLNS
jgi:hypothetical protein